MSAKTQRGRRRVLHAVTVTALLAGSACLTVALRAEEQTAAPAIPAVTDEAGLKSPLTRGLSGDLTWERLRSPARSVLRGEKGEVFATFTDGARTATLTGRSRTFTEPAATRSRIVTDNWVRMMPEPWRKGAEKEKWFKDWFKDNFGSEKDDLFAMAFQYVAQAPAKQNAAGSGTRATRTTGRSLRTAGPAPANDLRSPTSMTTWASRTPSGTAPRCSPRGHGRGPWTAPASSGRCWAIAPATP